jgi:hypothetical protein
MQRHGAFWTDLVNRRIAVVCGPALDPGGIFGIGVIEAEDESVLHAMLESAPGKGLLAYEIQPMRAVHAGRHSV